jgi:diaminohydroxyphosphoribosylaminopyrimidine deaminase / 5-amino-6-(5-phosphoribosylamino)uracil reductase
VHLKGHGKSPIKSAWIGLLLNLRGQQIDVLLASVYLLLSMSKSRSKARQKPKIETGPDDLRFMRFALQLARKGLGNTSPNPMVGAVLVKNSKVIGKGWHHRAGEPHAEIEAFLDAKRRGFNPAKAALYVTLEPCSTQGRTPPCTRAIIEARVARVVVGNADPNPRHRGNGFRLLRRAGIEVETGVLSKECEDLNEAFNHWIVNGTPWVTVKTAMTLDGKIATASGESKWITGEPARREGMALRRIADAILVGINTILTDDPSLTFRDTKWEKLVPLRRIILDSLGRTPSTAKVVRDGDAKRTTIFVSRNAPLSRVKELRKTAEVEVAPLRNERNRISGNSKQKPRLDLRWILQRLGAEGVTSLLVEGGGEVNASFLMDGLAHRVAFFYAPRILGGRDARKAVAGEGARNWAEVLRLDEVRWKQVGEDLSLSAKVKPF